MASAAPRAGGELRERIRTVLAAQAQDTVTVLSSLLAVQDEFRYLPEEAIEETATFVESTINEVWSVASFYTNFRFTPPGEHMLEVCWGPSCHIMGAQKILQSVQVALGVDRETETEDGRTTLAYGTCLGACAQAPVIAVDHHHQGKMTPEKASEIARELAKS